ncbi:MAG TPA: ATP-binding protein, partial [Candidatus Wunengus sp. YC65]|uniref:ATP-binding protein n=1 Tax=Candidatus Wunengus sp. YC65 TaxID=3367701 RepID=UPI004029CD5C
LIIDDSTFERRILKSIIEKDGHEVIDAIDGQDGFEKAKFYMPDLVISDILMPNVDGFQFLINMKKDKNLKSIPVVVYSSVYEGDEDRELALKLGAESYIAKPEIPEEIWKSVKTLIDKIETKKEFAESGLVENDERFLKSYSQIVATRLEEKVKILNKEIATHKRLNEEFYLLQSIALAISATQNLHDALIITLKKICNFTGWVYGEAWMLNSDGTLLVRNHRFYCNRDNFEIFTEQSRRVTFPPGVGLPGRTWSTKQPVWVRDVTVDPNYLRAPIAREAGLKTGIAFPVIAGNEVVAVIVFYHEKVEEKNERLIKLIFSVLSQIGSFIKRKQAERETEKLRNQLYHAQKLASVGKLAGGVAHNFNNLLMVVMGYASLLQTELKEDDPLREYAQKIISSSQTATNLAHDLLTFSRKQPINPQPVNMNGIIKDAESILSKLIRENIKMNTMLTDKDCIVMADSDQMKRILMNLTTNARDDMPEGGSLTISTDVIEIDDTFIKAHGYGEVGKYVLISFSDTGIGMDEDTRLKIFDPFFKEIGRGTGLGLAIVYGLVKQHNGYIDVDSTPGKGTTFKIYLPLIESEAED